MKVLAAIVGAVLLVALAINVAYGSQQKEAERQAEIEQRMWTNYAQCVYELGDQEGCAMIYLPAEEW